LVLADKVKQPVIYLTERQRAYLYRVLIAIVPLLGVYGVVDQRAVAFISALIAATLGFSLAAANTSTKRDDTE
jgi:hypothetical protein